jgi:hypothetical protein
VFVRKDIPLSAQVVQTGHACLEAGSKFPQPVDRSVYLVVLAVTSEEKLLEVVEWVNQQNIQIALFYEPDDGLGYTAACTQPVLDPQRAIFRKYSIWTA